MEVVRCTAAPCSGSIEWIIPSFLGCEAKVILSPTFRIGGYAWRLQCYPGSDATNPSHGVAVFLSHPAANRNHTSSDSQPRPDLTLALTVANHKNDREGRTAVGYSASSAYWGFGHVVRREQLTPESGFLTSEGSLLLRLALTVNKARKPLPLCNDTGLLAADLEALLDNPVSTSDLTIIAGGSSEGAHPQAGCARSFRVHRAILAARCPYFRTLFASGMADSAARELPLPDADPDAFAVLLRYMYCGAVPPCDRALQRAVRGLSDRLLLPSVREAMDRELVDSADDSTITADLLWAAQGGREKLLEELTAVYKQVAKDVDPADVMAMATANPQLAGHLLVESARGTEQEGGRRYGTLRLCAGKA